MYQIRRQKSSPSSAVRRRVLFARRLEKLVSVRRVDKPFPLAAYLSSRDPALRARAETELYRLGPNAGEALLHAAEIHAKPLFTTAMWVFVTCFIPHLVVPMLLISKVHQSKRSKRLQALALALARRDDLRGVGPLVDVWQYKPLLPGRKPSPAETVEAELSRLLPDFISQNRLGLRKENMDVLRRKATRLYPRRVSGWRVRPVPRGEFTDTRADLLVTIIQLLTRTGDSKDRAVVERIARSVARTENQQLVREAAQVCLDVLPRPLHQRLPPLTSHQPSAPARVSVRKQIP